MAEKSQPKSESDVIFIKVSISVSKNLVLKKISVSVSKINIEKSLSLGLKIFGLKKVSVSVSKTVGLEKSLGISLENIWSQRKSWYRARMKFLVSSLSGE